jgi:hypothetical protein
MPSSFGCGGSCLTHKPPVPDAPAPAIPTLHDLITDHFFGVLDYAPEHVKFII